MSVSSSRIVAIAVTFALFVTSHSQEKPKVLAKLGEQTITDRDVDFYLGRISSENGEKLNELPPAVMQSTIYLIAQQRQALQTLRTRKLALGREDVERWLDENSQPRNGEKQPAAQIIREQASKAGVTESNLRDHWAFRLSWQRFLQQQLTDANVAKHFENQPKRFDGTRFKVSIVDVAATAGRSDRREKIVGALNALRNRLVKGDLAWKDLESELQRAESLGEMPVQMRVREDLWVRGTGDLDPTIVSTLVKLEPNSISDPIHTPTGVHLVKLLEIEAGTKELADVRDEVRAHMLIHLLDHLAKQSESQLPLKSAD